MDIQRIMVAGIGTEVGKTVVSAILATMLNADYWKPIQCGDESNADTTMMKKWLVKSKHTVFEPAYSLKAPLSPHHAARLENVTISIDKIKLPNARRPLIIEGVGGILVPLKTNLLTIDLFAAWNCKWVIVSRNYLGSINHTLLTLEVLKKRKLPILGIIFNGEDNPDTEAAILENSQLPLLGKLYPENHLNQHIFKRYSQAWLPNFSKILR